MAEPDLEGTFPGSRVAVGYWTGWSTGTGSVLPDGHVDIVAVRGHVPFLAGPDTRPVAVTAPAGAPVVGLRLRAGVAAAVFGTDARQLVDQRIVLDSVLHRPALDQLAEALASSATNGALATALLEAIEAELPESWEPDFLVVEAAAAIRAGNPIDRSELSPRQFRRRFTATMGYGPKIYQRICRFNRFIEVAGLAPADRALAGLAAEAGYYDQAHLGRDASALAGTTPARLRAP